MHSRQSNLTLLLAQPARILGEIANEEDGQKPDCNGDYSFNDEYPAPAGGVHAVADGDE